MSLRIRKSGNDELVNHLISRNLISSTQVERVHRAVDRAKYVSPVDKDQAYMMRPWRRGPLHLSSPCIYGPVLEGLELKPGLSFLNVGSGTGYLSTMAGLILGPCGINHGVEVEPSAVEYANNILEQFIESSPILDEIDFCDTKFYNGNGLCLSRQQALYDRLYCGTECSTDQLEYFKRLIRIGGVLVLPVHNVLVQVKRTSVDRWTSKNLLNVIFAKLMLPSKEETANPFEIDVLQPPSLKILCCVKVRERLRIQQGRLRGPLLRRPLSNDTNVDALLRLVIKRNPCQTYSGKGPLVFMTTPKLTGKEGITLGGNGQLPPIMDPMVHDDSDIKNSKDDEHPSSSSTAEEEVDSKNRREKSTNFERLPRLSESTDSSKSPIRDSIVHDDSDIKNSRDDEHSSSSSTDEEEDDSKNRREKLFSFERVPRLYKSTGSPKRSSLIDDSTSSSSRSSPSPSAFAFFVRCLEQINNTGINQSDGPNTSDDSGLTNKTTEKKPNSDISSQSSEFHDSTSSIYSRTASTLGSSFIRFLEQTKNARRFQSDASDTSDDNDTDNITETNKEKIIATGDFRSIIEVTNKSNKQSEDDKRTTDKDTELKRIPLLFDVSLLRPFTTEIKNESNIQSSSEDEESIDDDKKTKSKGSLFDTSSLRSVRETKYEANEQTDLCRKLDSGIDEFTSSELNVLCPKDKQIKGLRVDVQFASASVQQVAEHDRLMQPQPSDDVTERIGVAEIKSSSKHPMLDRYVEGWTQKSDFTENNVVPEIFARLNIADPTTVSLAPLTITVNPVTVPVSFKTLPEYIDKIWDTMQSFKCRSFGELDNETNKAIFKKGALLLAEAKVAYGQRTTSATPDEDLPTSKAYNKEELIILNQMAAKLPMPIALYLECLGTTKDGDQVITPVLAEYAQDVKLSGAMTYAPMQMVKLLQLLREGVPLHGVVHQLCLKELEGLPMILWENFCTPVVPPLIFGQLMVRITEESYNFWITSRYGFPTIKWEHSDHNLFKRIVNSFYWKKGFNVDVDLSHGIGSLAQVVQIVDWNIGASTRWFTMVPVDEESIKFGVGFAFSRFSNVQPSRFTGSLGDAYMRGEITPFRIMSAILHNL